MPKMKTKSSAKKRFKLTGTGKVKFKPAGKKHGMVKRTKNFIRSTRAMAVLCPADTKIVKLFISNKK